MCGLNKHKWFIPSVYTGLIYLLLLRGPFFGALSQPRARLIGHFWGGLAQLCGPLAQPTHPPCFLSLWNQRYRPRLYFSPTFFSYNKAMN